jgi:predicted dehydrogenase
MDSITEIFGTKGNGYGDLMSGSGLTIYTPKASGLKWRGDKGWHKPAFDENYENGYQAQILALADTIRNDAPPAQSGRDGLEILKIMEAAYRSGAQGSKVMALKQ